MPKLTKKKAGPDNRHQMLPSRDEVEVRKNKRRVTHDQASKTRSGDGGDRDDSDDEDGEEYLSPDMTRKILEQARHQRDEMEVEGTAGRNKRQRASPGTSANEDARIPFANSSKQYRSRGAGGMDDSDDDDEGSDEADGGDDDDEGSDEADLGGNKDTDGASLGGMGMSESEERLVANFMNSAPVQRRTLADIILEKIREKEEREARAAGLLEDEEDGEPPLPPKVIEVFKSIGKILKTYTAGKLPKAFKMVPYLTHWEQILWLTRPEKWSSHATLAATKIFASNFNAKMAQRFFNIFLLEACRTDIQENRRLNYHLYEALHKSVYKPAAFYKGMILPLASSPDCTFREASIFASVLARVSIPANHSAVAILKLAQLPYNGATSLFIRVLLNKKYALPYKVIDALVDHFMSYLSESRDLPVLWHQSLLVFAQRYRGDITRADKDRLKELMKAKHHHQITPEVRRQLFIGGCRGDPKTDATTPATLPTPGSSATAFR